MQVGSGTYNFLPGLTYLGAVEKWAWGAHVDGVVRIGDNKFDYTLGNRYDITAWGARKLTDWSSGSLRLDWPG